MVELAVFDAPQALGACGAGRVLVKIFELELRGTASYMKNCSDTILPSLTS